MKRCILAILIAGVINVTPALAAGVPVADGVQIAGQLRELTQGIRDYEEYIQQSVLSNNQLLEAYKRYDQMLSEYKQVLREAERLKAELKGVDLQNFLDRLKNIDMYDPSYSTGDDANVGNAPWDNAVERNKLLNGWGMTDEEWSEMNSSIPYLANDRQRAQAIFKYRKRKAEMAIRQDVASENFDANIAAQAEEAQKTKDALDSLGDNDTLATQQLIARQNQLMIEQNLNNQAQGNTDFKMSNQISNEYFNNMAKARERREKNMARAYKGED